MAITATPMVSMKKKKTKERTFGGEWTGDEIPFSSA